VNVYLDGEKRALTGRGNGPIAAFVDALSTIGFEVRVLDYAEHALSSGGDARAAAYVECAIGVDGNFYIMSAPNSLFAKVTGVVVHPSDPPLVVGAGGRDGESMPIAEILALRLAAGDDFPS
jgi:hypothetical protein